MPERGRVTLQGRQTHVSVARLEPSDRGLRRSHASRHLGLGQTECDTARDKISGERTTALGHLLEPRKDRVVIALRHVDYGISYSR